MTITPEMWLYLAIGFGAGFLLEFLIDLIFWRRRSRRLARQVDDQKSELVERNKELNETRANLEETNNALALTRTHLETAESKANRLGDTLVNTQNTLSLREQSLTKLEYDHENLYRRLQNTIGRSGQLDQQLHTQQQKASLLHTQLEQAQLDITDLESRMHVPEDAWDALNGRIRELKEQLLQEDIERSALASRLDTAVKRAGQAELLLEESKEEADRLAAQNGSLGTQLHQAITNSKNLEARLQTAVGQAGQANLLLQDTRQKLTVLQAKHAQTTTQLAALQEEVLVDEDALTELRSQLSVNQEAWDSLNERIGQLNQQRNRSEQERQNIAARLQTAVGRSGQLEKRLQDAQAHIQRLTSQLTQAPATTETVHIVHDQLQKIKGIGPVYEKQLHEAGIFTFEQLAGQTEETLRDIIHPHSWQAPAFGSWVDEAVAFTTSEE